MTPPSSISERPPRWYQAFLLIAFGYFGIWFLERFSGISVWDDAYLYTRYCDNLITEGKLAWNPDGEPTWGLTSLLHTFPVLILRLLLAKASPNIPLYLSTFLSGMGFLYLFTRGLLNLKKSREERRWVVLYVMILVTMNAPQLNHHLASGMDTMPSLLYITGLILLLARSRNQSSGRAMWYIALYAGAAWFVRPDLLAITVPAAVLIPVFGRAGVKAVFTQILALGLVLGAQLGTAWWMFGSPLPLPFYIKSLNPYGPEFLAHYQYEGFLQASGFLLANLIPVGLLGWFFFRKKSFQSFQFHAWEKALLVGCLLFFLYFLLGVTHIMAFSSRYYYPLFPALGYFGGRILLHVIREKNWKMSKVSGGMVLSGFLILCIGLLFTTRSIQRDRFENLTYRLGKFSMESCYHYLGRNVWPMLPDLAAFPNDLSVATTELGIPGAMLPGKQITDLSGLTDPRPTVLRQPLSEILSADQVDWVYMPHPDYAAMHEELEGSERFAAEYAYFTDKMIGSYQGVAIRKESPYFEQMEKLIRDFRLQMDGGN